MSMLSARAKVILAAAAVTAMGGIAPVFATAATQTATKTATQTTVSPSFAFNPGLPLLDSSGRNTGAAEPSLAVDAAGHVYVTGPEGVPTGGCPFWTVHPGQLNAKGLPYDYRGRFDIDHGGVGGGDCDVATGGHSLLAPSTETVAASSLSLANLTTNISTDAGKTFRTPANNGSEQVFGDDRQWNVADPTLGTVYMTVHDVATSNIQSAVSYDGGYTYVQNTPAIDAATFPAATMDNHFSTTVVDPTTHKLYLAFVAPANAQENAAAQAPNATSLNEHVVYVAVGDPCAAKACVKGQPLGPISWKDYPLYTAPSGQDLAHIFPMIAIDRGDGIDDKTVYVGWAGDTHSSVTNRFQLTHFAIDAGTPKGSKPIYVDDGTNHSNMFPWLVGGGRGVVDAAWYSGRLVGSGTACPSGQTGSSNDSNGVNNNCFNQWHVSFAQVTGAAGSTPVVTRSYASGINHRGSICDQGLNCSLFGGDRSLLDFFDMDLDPAGGANIAYVADPSQIEYTRQCTGRSATTGHSLSRGCGSLGTPPPPPPGPTCGTGTNHAATVVTDAAGDENNPTGGGTNGSADARAVNVATNGTNIDVSLTIQTLTDPAVPPPGTADIYYYTTWTAPNGKHYAVEHDEPQPPGAKTYTVGEFDPATNQLTGTTTPITGSYTAGAPGTITWHVPKALIGNPTVPTSTASTAALQSPYAVTILGEGAAGTGLVFVAPADRAPNSGFGATWAVC